MHILILDIYLNFYQKNASPLWPDTSRLPGWEAVCLCSLGKSMAISARSKALGWRSHQTSGGEGPRPIGLHHCHHPHPTGTISDSDFCHVLKECPLSLWMTTKNTASRDRNAKSTLSTSACVQVSVPLWIKLRRTGACSVTSWLPKWYLHSLTSQQQQVMAASPLLVSASRRYS